MGVLMSKRNEHVINIYIYIYIYVYIYIYSYIELWHTENIYIYIYMYIYHYKPICIYMTVIILICKLSFVWCIGKRPWHT